MRIAAVGDIHVNESDRGKWTSYFEAVSKQADIFLICGDLTDSGDILEAEVLAGELKACTIPVVAVLGNHDYERNQQDQIRKILINDKVHILDGDSIIINDVGFAGIKGFGGGFDKYMLAMFGEDSMKNYVQEAVNESLRLDRALKRLESKDGIKKIAVLHYSPVKATVKGEPEEIFPFMGSSRLAEPINRREVLAAFHGHAHLGTLEGATSKGVRVFNVSKSILEKAGYIPPFFILEV